MHVLSPQWIGYRLLQCFVPARCWWFEMFLSSLTVNLLQCALQVVYDVLVVHYTGRVAVLCSMLQCVAVR